MRTALNQVMWSVSTAEQTGGTPSAQLGAGFDTLRYFSDDKECAVQIDGSKVGFFDAGWLEGRRVHRHLYACEWLLPQMAGDEDAGEDAAMAEPVRAYLMLQEPATRCQAARRPSSHVTDVTARRPSLGSAPLVVLRAGGYTTWRHAEPLRVLELTTSLLQAATCAASSMHLLLLTAGGYECSRAAQSGLSASDGSWALARTAQDYYQSLSKHGSNKPFAEHMFDFDGLNTVIGTAEMLKKGARYDGSDD